MSESDSARTLAQLALDRLTQHEGTCAERYERIEKNQNDAKAERQAMHEENKARIDRLYGRAWLLAGFVVSGALTVTGVLLKITWDMLLMRAGIQP